MDRHAGKLVGPMISLGAVVLCILAAEIVLHFLAPVPDPYASLKHSPETQNPYIRSDYPPNFRFTTEAETGLPGLEGKKVFSINNMGFRGEELVMPKPQEEFRIFMIGGSTTECFYLDDSESITAVLQKELANRAGSRLSIKVYNAGKGGDASDDHISMLVHRIVHLEPDLIIVFAGINDLIRPINNHDYLHYYLKRHTTEKLPIYKFIATEFQIPRRLYYLLKKINPTAQEVLETIESKTHYKSIVATVKSFPVTEENPKTNLKAYSNNLRTMIGVAKAHNVQLVFMTQQTTWNSTVDPHAKDWHWLLCGLLSRVRYREDLMNRAMESINDVMRQVSRENSVPVYDLATKLPKSLDYFYDDVHFNVKGASVAGQQLASFILESNLIPKQK